MQIFEMYIQNAPITKCIVCRFAFGGVFVFETFYQIYTHIQNGGNSTIRSKTFSFLSDFKLDN